MDPKIVLQPLGKTGSHSDYLVRVTGPGDTDYTFDISITDTILAVWGSEPTNAANQLTARLVYSHGTSSPFPQHGYWFDSYNSETTLSETLNKINNFGQEPFLKHRATPGTISAIFGGDLLTKIEDLSFKFFTVVSRPLMGSLDYAFERSEAEDDLGTPANSKPELLYRICILSVLIDGFRLRLSNEPSNNKSLKALTNWLTDRFDLTTATMLTETFRKLKDLRKQYPIHEHFERDASGQRVVRDEVTSSEQYFGFREIDDYSAKWKKVVDAFRKTIEDISTTLDQLDSQSPEPPQSP